VTLTGTSQLNPVLPPSRSTERYISQDSSSHGPTPQNGNMAIMIIPTSGSLPTFDIEGRTFDIVISRYCNWNLRYRTSVNDLRYRDTILHSISKVLTSDIECSKSDKHRYRLKVVTFDIDPVRYRRIFDIEAWNIDIDSVRYRRNFDIEVQNFDIVKYRYRRFLDIE
jgi:hypothetical protein